MATIEGQAVSISHLGKVLLEMGDLLAAQDAFSRGLLLARCANRLSARGQCELGLAKLYAHDGNRQQASECARLAERTYTRLGIPDMAAEARSILWHALGPS